MNSIRQHILSKIMAFVAGLALLNMSFFLAEVSLLNFQERELLENISKLIINTGFEEERDGESAGGKNLKEVLLKQQIYIHGASSFLISIRANNTLVDHYRHANHSLLFSPPPDRRKFS